MAILCNNENCTTLEDKLKALSILLNTIPPSGGGLVPYTDADRCGGNDALPSFFEMNEAIGNVVCSLACILCNLDICTQVESCLAGIDLCPFVSACLPNLPSSGSNSAIQGVLARDCGGSIVLAQTVASKIQIPMGNIGDFQTTPYSDPTWTQLPLSGAGGTYTSKIIQIGTFDLSSYPAACAGYKWVASINNQLDHIPSFALGPVFPQEEGYTGLQTFVNGAGGFNGPNLVGGVWIHRGGARAYGPTLSHHNYYDVVNGVNTITMQVSTTRSGTSYNELAEFGDHQIQIFVEQIKI